MRRFWSKLKERRAGVKVFRAAAQTRWIFTAICGGVVGGFVALLVHMPPPLDLATLTPLVVSCFTVFAAFFIPACIAWYARVVFDGELLQVYTWTNRCVFNVRWSQVTRFERVGSQWRLVAGEWDVLLPSVEDDMLLSVEILRRLPPSALRLATRPNTWPPVEMLSPISSRGLRSHDYQILFAAFCVLPFPMAVASIMNVAEVRSNWLINSIIAFFIAAVMSPFWLRLVRSFRRIRRGKVEVNDDGIHYNDGEGPIDIRWRDVQFVVGPGSTRFPGAAESLLVVGKDRAIRIDNGFPEFHQVATLTVAQAPDQAAIFP